MGYTRASRKLQLYEFCRGSFYNQETCIKEYEFDKGLYYNNYVDDFDKESSESDSRSDSRSDSDSDCQIDRNNKKI